MLFDTDIIVSNLRGHQPAADLVASFPARSVSVMTYLETVYGARNKRDLTVIQHYFTAFEVLPLTPEIGMRAARYLDEMVLKVKLSPPDAVIAATAVEFTLPLCTAIIKHFGHIRGLELAPFRP